MGASEKPRYLHAFSYGPHSCLVRVSCQQAWLSGCTTSEGISSWGLPAACGSCSLWVLQLWVFLQLMHTCPHTLPPWSSRSCFPQKHLDREPDLITCLHGWPIMELKTMSTQPCFMASPVVNACLHGCYTQGKDLAIMELKILLASLARKCRFELASPSNLQFRFLPYTHVVGGPAKLRLILDPL